MDKTELTLDDGWDALELGAAEDALRLARAALALVPDSQEAQELEARALAETGDVAKARALLAAMAQAAPASPFPLLSLADVLLRDPAAHPDAAAKEALGLLARAARHAGGDAQVLAAIAHLEGQARLAQDDPRRALAAFDRALQADPAHLEARLDRGLLHFETGRFDAAKADLEAVAAPPAEDAEAWHTLGLIAERRGEAEAARRAFARATAQDPERFPAAITLSEAEFDAAVTAALAELPELARAQLGNVTIAVAPFPSDDDLDGGALSPTMLGVFQGTPHGARSVSAAADHATAQIVLFQRNLERFARDREELIDEIGVTVAHEVGHLLGLDEDDLYERGLD